MLSKSSHLLPRLCKDANGQPTNSLGHSMSSEPLSLGCIAGISALTQS